MTCQFILTDKGSGHFHSDEGGSNDDDIFGLAQSQDLIGI